MTTTFKFERLPMGFSRCEMTAEDGGKAEVLCEIPGYPDMVVRQHAMPVRNAPHIASHKAFEAFVRERFADDAS